MSPLLTTTAALDDLDIWSAPFHLAILLHSAHYTSSVYPWGQLWKTGMTFWFHFSLRHQYTKALKKSISIQYMARRQSNQFPKFPNTHGPSRDIGIKQTSCLRAQNQNTWNGCGENLVPSPLPSCTRELSKGKVGNRSFAHFKPFLRFFSLHDKFASMGISQKRAGG